MSDHDPTAYKLDLAAHEAFAGRSTIPRLATSFRTDAARGKHGRAKDYRTADRAGRCLVTGPSTGEKPRANAKRPTTVKRTAGAPRTAVEPLYQQASAERPTRAPAKVSPTSDVIVATLRAESALDAAIARARESERERLTLDRRLREARARLAMTREGASCPVPRYNAA